MCLHYLHKLFGRLLQIGSFVVGERQIQILFDVVSLHARATLNYFVLNSHGNGLFGLSHASSITRKSVAAFDTMIEILHIYVE